MEDSAERWAGENMLTYKVKTLVETCIIKASNHYQNNVSGECPWGNGVDCGRVRVFIKVTSVLVAQNVLRKKKANRW